MKHTATTTIAAETLEGHSWERLTAPVGAFVNLCYHIQMMAGIFQGVVIKDARPVGKVLKAARSPVVECFAGASKMILLLGVSAAWAFTLHADPIYSPGSPWRLAVVMLWGFYMAMIAWIMTEVTINMPYAPADLLEALFNVGWLWIGVSAVLVAHPVVYFGPVWMQISLSFLLAVLIVGVISFWVSLRRAYGGEWS